MWTGRELLLYGAVHDPEQRPRATGAAYNPAANTWRKLPPAPGPVENAEGGYTAVWTGAELLGGGLGLNAAYNPATNRWRRLPAMESNRIGHTAVWTGNQLLIWGGQTRRAGSWTAPAHGLAYNPASNRWSALPKSPLRDRVGHVAVWTGTQMLIWGGGPARETDTQRHFTDGAAYTPHPM